MQMSFLGDEGQFFGFLHHIGHNPWTQKLVDILAAGFAREKFNPHIDEWDDVEEHFIDLIKKLMALDLSRRITAREALQHPWFKDDESLED